jgi:hypothetical protein
MPGMGSFYRSQHELVAIFKSGDRPHRNNIQLGKYGRNRSNVWPYPSINSFGRSGEEATCLRCIQRSSPLRCWPTRSWIAQHEARLSSTASPEAVQPYWRASVSAGALMRSKSTPYTSMWPFAVGKPTQGIARGMPQPVVLSMNWRRRGRSNMANEKETDETGSGRDYDVGYGKPPRATRFRKGQSGNPRGRPRGSRNTSTLLEEAFNESVVVTEHGKRKRITKRAAMIKQLAKQGRRGRVPLDSAGIRGSGKARS